MMENKKTIKRGRAYEFWISHSQKCLSFHPESKYETLKFPNYLHMWQRVHEFVNQGYLVQ